MKCHAEFCKDGMVGKLIEHEIKNKKIEGKHTSIPPANKATLAKKKEGDAYAIFVNQQSRGKTSYAIQPSYFVNPLPPIQPLSYISTPIATPT